MVRRVHAWLGRGFDVTNRSAHAFRSGLATHPAKSNSKNGRGAADVRVILGALRTEGAARERGPSIRLPADFRRSGSGT